MNQHKKNANEFAKTFVGNANVKATEAAQYCALLWIGETMEELVNLVKTDAGQKPASEGSVELPRPVVPPMAEPDISAMNMIFVGTQPPTGSVVDIGGLCNKIHNMRAALLTLADDCVLMSENPEYAVSYETIAKKIHKILGYKTNAD